MFTQQNKFIAMGPWLWGFILLHIMAWTIAPLLVRYNLPMDALEGATWGHQLQWGYDKNPYLNAWITALALKLGGESGKATYLISQLSVGIVFWAVFNVGKKILSPLYAFVAVLLLEGMQYYNFHAIDLSDNTLELATWALTILFFYQAIAKNHLHNWLLTGLFGGLALMTKYYSALLLVSMLIFLCTHAHTRKNLLNVKFYIACSILITIILPHLIWLYQHDFITVRYMFQRIDTPATLWNHLFFPAQFAWQQFEVILPTLIFWSSLFLGKNPNTSSTHVTVDIKDKQFLFYVGLGPFLLTLILSLLTGIKLRAGWGMPLFSFFPLILLLKWQPKISFKKFYYFILMMFIYLLVNIGGYCLALIRATETSSAVFPGKEIAEVLTQRWHQQYHVSLSYVAGTRWIAGNVSLYSKDRPAVYINWDLKISPWIQPQELVRHGAIFIWDPAAKEHISYADIKAIYPSLRPPETLYFAWKNNKLLPPIVLQVLWVGPKELRSGFTNGLKPL